MIALDTNLLVYAHRAATPQHKQARHAITRASQSPVGWGFSLSVILEFWSVVTHPASAGRPSTPEQAAGFVAGLRVAGAQVWMPGGRFAERVARLATELSVVGPRVFDLQIALMAFEGGATELWTADHNFTSVPGLPVVLPLERPARPPSSPTD